MEERGKERIDGGFFYFTVMAKQWKSKCRKHKGIRWKRKEGMLAIEYKTKEELFKVAKGGKGDG